jgi:AraC-like DNA-binding protein
LPHQVLEIRGTDTAEIHRTVSDVFCRHEVRPLAGGPPVPAHLLSYRAGGFGVARLDYGVPITIQPEVFEDFYLVQITLAGRSSVRHGAEELLATPATAFVLGPDRAVLMRRGEHNPHLIVSIDRDTLDAGIADLLGYRPRSALRFALPMPLGDPAAAAWSRAVQHVAAEVDARSPVLEDPRWVRRTREGIVERLLLSQAHELSPQLTDVGPRWSGAVAAARRLVEDADVLDLTVADLARHAGVSLRTLQESFRVQVGTTPTQYLRDRRLDRVRSALRAADPATTTVTDVAFAHGFTHLGRFATEYRTRHGEPPSHTLRG